MTEETKTNVSRRDFIKYGLAVLTVVSGGGAVIWSLGRSDRSFAQSRPRINPGFGLLPLPGAALRCYTYDGEGHETIYELNDVGATLLRACDGSRTACEIAEETARRLAPDFPECTKDFTAFLEKIYGLGLVSTDLHLLVKIQEAHYG